MKKIGVILVHGIGEQKRFQHLDSEIRNIIDGLARRPSTRLTVEILGNDAATYNADQDTWASGKDPSARITVIDDSKPADDRNFEINVHEVWWADVNEPYSLAKQVRFWLWGLSMWTFPSAFSNPNVSALPDMHMPTAPGRTLRKRLFVRLQLFLAGLFFMVAAFSLGALVFLANRLFGLEPPDFVRVFVNYISGVKLYNQNSRQGGGFLPNSKNMLDAIDDPPRASVRRRMIRAITAVAFRPGQEYDRWYILAHSLGSVVAFNGIMEPGQSFANYLSRSTWDELVAAGWAGPKRPADWARVPPGDMMPKRPIWLNDDDIVHRDMIFSKFRGLLTYGSPLGKFAELWKARVPVNKQEPIFKPNVEWINVFDGRDPVAGPLKAFLPENLKKDKVKPEHCPKLTNYPYIASPILLLSHIKYFTVHKSEPTPQLADVVTEWLLSGKSFTPPAQGEGRWTTMKVYWRRVCVSYLWWIGAFVALAALSTISIRTLTPIVKSFISSLLPGCPIQDGHSKCEAAAISSGEGPGLTMQNFRDWLSGVATQYLPDLFKDMLVLTLWCALVVLIAGFIGWLRFKDPSQDKTPSGSGSRPQPTPGNNADMAV